MTRGEPWQIWALALGTGAASAAAVAVSGGNLVVAAIPPLAVAALWFTLRMPLRWTVSALLLAWLALEQGSDADGLWHTPLYHLGDFFAVNLGNLIHLPALKINGQEITLLLLCGVILHRKSTGSRLDSEGQVQTAGVLGDLVLVWFLTVAVLCGWGLANGAAPEVVIWHARPTVAYGLLFVVFHSAYRGPRDQVTVGRIIVLAACVKAVIAMFLMFVVHPTIRGEPLAYATNHWDSILFALATMILIVSATEKLDRRRVLRALVLLPVIAGGMIANNRRLVWVELVMALLLLYFVSPWRPWKRALARAVVCAVPVLLLYVAAGWSSSSGVFAPVKMIRTVVDSKVDRSTWDRDVENWNLVLSIRDSPLLLGRGFGHEYTEYVVGDDISRAFPMYKALPHNSILGWLLFSGLLGFTALWSLLVTGIFLAARAYHRAADPVDRTTALSSMAAILIVCVQAYGDLGIGSYQARILVPLALAFTGKLAVATGAWPRRVRRGSTARAPSLGAPA